MWFGLRLQYIGESRSLFVYINHLRIEIAQILEKSIQSKRANALLIALSIGDKSHISFTDSQLFQQTGTAHLIAISGLHIGLMAYIGLMIAKILFFFFPNERISRIKLEAYFAICFALFYALLAGLSIPTIRAFIMVAVFAIAHVKKVPTSRWQAWSIAMMVVLVLDPLSVLDVGFWFSFGAVALLMFTFTGRKLSKNKIILFLKAQLIILIGLMPLMLIVFHKINLLTPIANVIVLPLASIVLIPLLFISLICYIILPFVADYLFIMLEKVAWVFFSLLDYLQTFSFLNFSVASLNTILLIGLVLFSLVLLMPRLIRFKLLALFLLVPLFIVPVNQLKKDEFNVHVLDVGQGLSIVIQTKNHTVIYDTGAKFDSNFSLAHAVIIPYLQSKGIVSIDKLILSHEDNDHAGGAQDLITYSKNIEVVAVTREANKNYQTCLYPMKWNYDGVLFEVLSPLTKHPYFGNNSSCVIKISNKTGSLLLTADIEQAVEYRLSHKFAQLIQSDVLLVPHHGSKTSSTLEFLQLVNPKIAINSSGFANQFNHPHPEIKQLYLSQGIKFLDTQKQGMISLNFSRNEIKLKSFAQSHKHLWQIN